ncbi:MAG: vitamin K epoxide reductase family protein, partial [Acidimicrobiales bacterium]
MNAPQSSTRSTGWFAIVSGVLCLAGIAVAAYLTYAHYTTTSVLACSDRGLIDCAKVTTSSYSRILGVPVSDTGLVFFMIMAALCSPPAWRSP